MKIPSSPTAATVERDSEGREASGPVAVTCCVLTHARRKEGDSGGSGACSASGPVAVTYRGGVFSRAHGEAIRQLFRSAAAD
jgi:hypothetical protein